MARSPADPLPPLRSESRARVIRHALEIAQRHRDRGESTDEVHAQVRELYVDQLRGILDGDRHVALLELDESLAAGSISQAEHQRRSAVQRGAASKQTLSLRAILIIAGLLLIAVIVLIVLIRSAGIL